MPSIARLIPLVLVTIILATAAAADQAPQAIDIGSRRAFFVDRFLIESLIGASLQFQPPRDEGIALRFDRP
jgi:hypothetical protein